ncbi:hypothetical protein LQR30_08665 [Chromobacterium piscinae]|uniref:hypothetical protein n=1 Tax=Chromobacterium piscinae TaxID=686831 RepID=UPI001E63A2AA|nr:hypothetical protein [Chromobacterium piscinae]MCD4504175.1 hypothetical protein [Chromobacterium piscinae]
MDVLGFEAVAAHANQGSHALHVRNLVRDRLIDVGPGIQAIPEGLLDWRPLKATLVARQENARRITAISRWRTSNIDSTRIADWLNQPMRETPEAVCTLQHLRNGLEEEISTRGDKRITDPTAMASAFIADIARAGQRVCSTSHPSPAIQFLINAGLDLEDIDPSATFGETMDLLTFQKRLRIVSDANGLPWPGLKRTVTQQQLPVTVIEESMRAYAHDQPERKGSELNDMHLLCLAPYADVTYVDKRTLESVRRARSKVAVFDQLVGCVTRAGGYAEIAAGLAAQS